jgi:UbiD family decarboxylase
MKSALGRSEFAVPSAWNVDCEQFRLRKFVELLGREGELEIVDDKIDLIEIGARLDGNPKAVLFRAAGPEGAQLVGNVVGGRRRLALAFGVREQDLLPEVLRRLKTPIAPVEVRSEQAPVHQVVWTGDDADFTKLPVHLQHGFDGGIYISASIDISQSPDGKRRNVGYRRLMVRGRKEAGVDLLAPSDLRVAYGKMVDAKKSMPIAFVIGSHPTDSITAVSLAPIDDEIALMGGLRGQLVPLVKCITNDVMVPADAEIVLEGYLDEKGWREPEGPFGEYLGYYGQMKTNPVFHLTAITSVAMRCFRRRQSADATSGRQTPPSFARCAPKLLSGRPSRPRFASRSPSIARRRRGACSTCGFRCGPAIPANRAMRSRRYTVRTPT